MPLAYIPFVLSGLSDALVALRRIGTFLLAEELDEAYGVDAARKDALDVDGDFIWETVGKLEDPKKSKGKKGAAKTPDEKENDTGENPFALKSLKLSIPRGSFVAIVGRVGSGKVRGLFMESSGSNRPHISRVPYCRL